MIVGSSILFVFLLLQHYTMTITTNVSFLSDDQEKLVDTVRGLHGMMILNTHIN